VQAFEKAVADYVGATYAVAVTSCTAALQLSLIVSGIGEGDEVIVPSLSFIATANAVIHAGAKPVFVDIDPETCNIDFQKIEAAITSRTKAIMPVHQMGLPVDLERVGAVAEKYGLPVLEDAACAIGSEYKGKKIGGHGHLACFSFHPRKIITTGEGGMITTDDAGAAEKLRRLRHQGMSVSDLDRHQAARIIIENYPERGYNFRMTDLQAAVGLEQMKKLPGILEKRRDIAKKYNTAFLKISSLKVPEVPDYAFHNYQSYWLEVLPGARVNRNELMERLLEKEVSSRRGIMAIHQEPAYVAYHAALPHTERISANTIILPLYPAMTDKEVRQVIEGVKDSLKAG
jgi:dTDP-4-amino-4,6-dideoxygalactose transaminase